MTSSYWLPSNVKLFQELYDSCVKLRPTLFRLASDTDDSETALMDILRANDDVSRIIQTFEKIVSPHLSSTVQKTENTNAPASSSGRFYFVKWPLLAPLKINFYS